jgi:hypothetical protein
MFIKFLGLILIMGSKEILVFNEEVLIVLAFSIFIYLVGNYGGNMISGELNNKTTLIKIKFDTYKIIQEKTILHLYNYHNKRTILSNKLQAISKIKNLRVNTINLFTKNNIKNEPTLQLEASLNRSAIYEFTTIAIFQKQLVSKLGIYKIIN